MKQLFFLSALVFVVTGCDSLGTSQSVCIGQSLSELSGADQVNQVTITIDTQAMPTANAKLTRLSTGEYQMHMSGDSSSDPDQKFAVCKLGDKLYGTLVPNTGDDNGPPQYQVYRVQSDDKSIVWTLQTADMKLLDKNGIHYVAKQDTIEGIQVQSIAVDLGPANQPPTAAWMNAFLSTLHDQTEGGVRIEMKKR